MGVRGDRPGAVADLTLGHRVLVVARPPEGGHARVGLGDQVDALRIGGVEPLAEQTWHRGERARGDGRGSESGQERPS